MTALWGADANVLGWQKADVGGIGTSTATLAAVRSYLIDTYLPDGLGPNGKFFDGGSGWHATYTSFAGSGYGGKANERHPVICAKTHTAASFNTLMTDMAAALPAGEIWYACFYSEVEAGFNAGALTHSTYQSTWAEMDTLRAAHPHGAQVKFIPILMAFQEISGTQHWADFLTPVLAVADVIGWDVYDDNGDPQSWSFATDIYPAIQALQTASGLPWSIPEYGLQVSTHSGSTDNAAGVLARWEAMVAVCEADPDFLWGNYWMDGPHAANQRSAVIRTDSANADYLTSLVAAGPDNDAFTAATVITGSTGTIAGSTATATVEGSEPARGTTTDWYLIGDPRAWYGGAYVQKWQVVTTADIPAGSQVTFPNPGTNPTDDGAMYLEIDVYTADPGDPTDADGFDTTSLTDLEPWADADGSNGSGTTSVDIPSGTTLWLIAQQWSDAAPTRIDWPPPITWDITTVLAWVDGSSTTIHPTPSGAFTQSPVGPSGEATVWYSWTPSAGRHVVSVPTGFSLAVFTGSSIGGLTLVNADYDNDGLTGWAQGPGVVEFTAAGSTVYHLRVNPYRPDASGAFTLHWKPPPANDDFADATDLTAVGGTIIGSLLGATIQAGEPDTTDFAPSSIWYSWTAAGHDRVTFSTASSPTDAAIHVYTGTDLTDLELVVRSREHDFNLDGSPVGFHAQPGTTYWIRVIGGRGAMGDTALTWATVGPSNDDFADAIPATVGETQAIFGAATTEEGEPAPAEFSSIDFHNTVWWTWTAPSADPFTFTPHGAGWVELLTGTVLADLTVVPNDDGDPCWASQGASDTEFTVTPVEGTTYWIRCGLLDTSLPGLIGRFTILGPAVAFIGDESFHTHGGSAYFGTHVATITGSGWASNLRSRSATATIDIGDTAIDGLTFTNDQALLEPDWQLPPPSLPNGPAAHIIRKMWLDISGPPTFDNHHQPHAGSWPGTGGHPAKALHADWGHYRIKVGTKNVTSFRGAQTVITQLSRTDPFGDDTCSLTFPMIGPYEHRGNPGTDLHWLPGTDDDRHIPVTIHHVMHDGTVTTQFEGDISSIVDSFDGKSGPLVVNATGLLKTLDQRITKPRFNSDPIDIGRLIHQWTAYEAKYGWHGHPCPARHTGIPTAERGGYGDPLMTTTIQNLLASAQTGDGTKWTIRNHRPRGMRLHIRDLTTVHFTLWCGQPGVTHQLTRDLDQSVRAIFGEGQAHDIQFWRNTQYPNAQDNPPHYPLTAGAVFNPGGSHTGLAPFTDELNSRGYHLDSHDTYEASDANNIRAFQGDAGISVDGAIGPQTWNAAFADTSNSNALDAYIRPLAVTPAAEPFLYNGRGGRIGRNPDYDHRTRREKLEQFGTLSKDDARRSAHLEMPVVSHSDYAGTVTLTNIDPPEVGALSIKAGWNFTFKNHAGVDRLLHIAKVDINPGMTPGTARTVTLTTSERGDDYITLAARMQRNRDVVDMSGRRRPSHRSSKHTPDFAPFDSESGAGFLTPRAQYAGLWNVYPIPAGELGSIVHVRLVANTPTLIAAAVFNRRVTARQLTALPGLADPSSGAAGGNDPWKVNAHKLTRNLKYADQPRMAWATGGPGAMQGYWPNDPSAGDSDITGVLDDSSPWNFHSARPPWLWLAVWTRDSCRIGGDPDYDHRALFPGPPP